MDVLMVLLRLIHIISGVFWAGTTFFMVSYVSPSVKATGIEGQKFMQQLGLRSGMTNALAAAATLAALSGIAMYAILTEFDGSAMGSLYFVILGIGAIAGIAGWFVGFFVQNRTTQKMVVLAGQIQTAGGPPTDEQAARMRAFSERIGEGSRMTAALLTIAIVAMAAAQPLSILLS